MPIVDTGWTASGIAYASGWSASPVSGWSAFGYRVLGGWVTLNGTLAKASWSATEVALTLPAGPAGPRPARLMQMDDMSISASGALSINKAGTGAVGVSMSYPLG